MHQFYDSGGSGDSSNKKSHQSSLGYKQQVEEESIKIRVNEEMRQRKRSCSNN